MAPDPQPPTSIDQIGQEAYRVIFPTDLLPGMETALLLFCAGFWGKNDGIFVFEAGVARVTGIDMDAERIAQMRVLYPIENWHLFVNDVYQWTEATLMHDDHRTWDVVILDPALTQMGRCHEAIPDWCSLAARTVIMGTDQDTVDGYNLQALSSPFVPDGWEITRVTRRNEIAHWVVLQKVGDR